MKKVNSKSCKTCLHLFVSENGFCGFKKKECLDNNFSKYICIYEGCKSCLYSHLDIDQEPCYECSTINLTKLKSYFTKDTGLF